jgi:two-component system LytT family sensor kinase
VPYISRDGDGQRGIEAAAQTGEHAAKEPPGGDGRPVARAADHARNRARPALLRGQGPSVLDTADRGLDRLLHPAFALGLREQHGRDVHSPHGDPDRHRLFPDPADGHFVPLADRDAAADHLAIIETWSISTFVKQNFRPVGFEYFGAIIFTFAMLAAWTALYYSINYFLLLEDEIKQREQMESQASTAQLAMLRYQLNPHFLFNTLNSISTLVLLKQTERANAMLARLSSFLRYTLANEPTAKVTLAQEVETLKLYLEIEKMRFEDRLRPHFKIESETIGARLPSLLLQPLIENAIKYAVTPNENGADIWITAHREGQAVRIEVADNGSGEGSELAASPSTGVGLANIRDRLTQAYGPAHGFTTRENDKGGFSVIIEIPHETGDQDT